MTDVASLRAAIGVEPVGEGRWRGDTSLGGAERGGVYGGQLIAQAVSACAGVAPPGSVPDSIHANLLGATQSGVPIDYVVERVRDGGALQHRDVRGWQDGSLVFQASVVSAMPSEGVDWQAEPMPVVGPPDTVTEHRPWSVGIMGDLFEMAFPVTEDDALPPWHPFWVRATLELPDDPWLLGAILAFWSDLGLNGEARLAHERVGGLMSTVSANHSLWLHRQARPNDWHLFRVDAQSLAGNQGLVRAELFRQDGALAASAVQGVFIRRPRN